MEPRPQKPRQPVSPQGTQTGQPHQPAPQVGPDPGQHTQQFAPQHGYDPAAFVAPPRAEYDYSPLDLQPPGQRRKRQVIAGIIGALVVMAIGTLIVAGWMALRDDEKPVGTPTPPDRVAELNSTPTEAAGQNNSNSTPGANSPTSAAQQPTAPPTPTAPAATVYDSTTIRSVLPPVESLPAGFVEAGDTPQDLAFVTEALGGTTEVQTLLADTGWQAAMNRTFTSSDPATTGTTIINVSVHAFKDPESAKQALTGFTNILESFGWTKVDGAQYGDGSQTLTFSNQDTSEDSVSIYFVDGQLLYRVNAIGPTDFDSTPNAVHVVNRLLGQ